MSYIPLWLTIFFLSKMDNILDAIKNGVTVKHQVEFTLTSALYLMLTVVIISIATTLILRKI